MQTMKARERGEARIEPIACDGPTSVIFDPVGTTPQSRRLFAPLRWSPGRLIAS